MTDLTPEREQEIREEASRNGRFIAGDGHQAVRVADWNDVNLLLAALDAERARADKLEAEAKAWAAHLDAAILNGADNVDRLHARNRNLEAVAEAARYVVEKAYNVAECGEHPDHLIDAEHAVRLLAAALAVLEEPPA